METVPIVKVSDINLAAALLCCEYDVRGVDNRDKKRAQFIFFDSSALSEDIDRYWAGDLNVDPKALANYRRELLTRIHEEGYK